MTLFFYNPRKCDSRGAFVFKVGGDLAYHIGHRIWQGGLGRGNAESLGEEFASGDINRRAFDAGASDIDAKHGHGVLDFGSDNFAQSYHSAMDAGLDCREWLVDTVGDLLLGEAAEVEHFDHFALVGI